MVSDELGSSDLDDNDNDKGKGSKFENFSKERLNKDYRFKWGMETQRRSCITKTKEEEC